MSENWEDVVEKHYLDILKGELHIALQKLLRVLKFWQIPASPLRAVEMIGPFCIHVLTFIIFEAFHETSKIQSGMLLYLLFLVAFTALLKALARIRMVSLSIAQLFSIMSYSQIWFIPFVFVSRFLSSGLARGLVLLVPFLMQPACAWLLLTGSVPDDTAIYLALTHFAYGLFLLVWGIVN